MKERLLYFDQMKGLAMIFVVMGHVMLFAFQINPSAPSRFIYINMPMFFYISGYLAYRHIESIEELGNRILRRGIILLLPYLMFSTLYGVFANWSNIVANLLSGRSGYWFLYDLFVISSFFLIWEYIIGRIKHVWINVFLWILPFLILIGVKYWVSKTGNGLYYSMVSSHMNYYRYYLVGYLCHKYFRFNDFLFKNDIMAAIGFVLYFLNWFYFDLHNMFLIFGGTMGGIIIIQRFFQMYKDSDSVVGKRLCSVGTMSLPIYVIHYFFIPDVSSIMQDIVYAGGGNTFIWQLLFSMLLVLPIVGASMFVGKLIETNKYLNIVFFGRLFK